VQVSIIIGSWAVVLGDDATVGTQHEFDALRISKTLWHCGLCAEVTVAKCFTDVGTPRGGLTRTNKA
jgi:hypothetical protein